MNNGPTTTRDRTNEIYEYCIKLKDKLATSESGSFSTGKVHIFELMQLIIYGGLREVASVINVKHDGEKLSSTVRFADGNDYKISVEIVG